MTISLQRLLGRPEEFFGLLEESARLGLAAATALHEMLTSPGVVPSLEAINAVRRQDKEVITTLEEMLGRVFITPMEREDLEQVAVGLYRLPKAIEKLAERYEFTWEKLQDVDFSLGSAMLVRAVEVVAEMVRCLRARSSLGEIKSLEARLSQIEADASYIILAATRSLYAPGTPPLRIIIAKELFEILTEGIDHCRSLGRTIALVMLKNS